MKQMSGQGSKAGMYRTLPPAFLPPSLAINSNCVFDEGDAASPQRAAFNCETVMCRNTDSDLLFLCVGRNRVRVYVPVGLRYTSKFCHLCTLLEVNRQTLEN